jgi:hypothetical protein
MRPRWSRKRPTRSLWDCSLHTKPEIKAIPELLCLALQGGAEPAHEHLSEAKESNGFMPAYKSRKPGLQMQLR